MTSFSFLFLIVKNILKKNAVKKDVISSSKRKKILLFGNYGGQNWGDEAILSGVLALLPKKVFDITVVTSDLEFTKKIHPEVNVVSPPPAGVRSVFQKKSYDVFKKIKQSDYILFGGGGLFQDREKIAPFLWSLYVLLCKFFKKKILFVGNSVGPLGSKLARFFTKQSFLGAKFISVRDEASKKLLEEILNISNSAENKRASFDTKKNNIEIGTDFIFALKKIPEQKMRRGTILMIRGDGNISVQRIKKISEFLPKPIFVVAMDTVDEEFAKKLPGKIFIPEDINHLRKKISASRLVVSSRLHGGLLSLQAETPFLLFSAAPKVKHFFKERGFEKIVFSENFQIPSLKKKVEEMKKNFLDIQENIRGVRLSEQKKVKNLLPGFLQK